MPIRRKVTGLKRGSKGFVYRIPISELGNLTEDEVNRNLREVYGTDKLQFNGMSLKDYFSKSKDPHDEILTIEYTGDDPNNEIRFGDQSRLWRSKYAQVKRKENYMVFQPLVANHAISSGAHTAGRSHIMPDSYDSLINILDTGFYGSFHGRPLYGDNILLELDSIRAHWGVKSKKDITSGDKYSICFVPNNGKLFNSKTRPSGGEGIGYVNHATPDSIAKVVIRIPTNTPKDKKEAKIKYYRDTISKKYNLPIEVNESRYNDGNWFESGSDVLIKTHFPKKPYGDDAYFNRMLVKTDKLIEENKMSEAIKCLYEMRLYLDMDLEGIDSEVKIDKLRKVTIDRYKKILVIGSGKSWEDRRYSEDYLLDRIKELREKMSFGRRLQMSVLGGLEKVLKPMHLISILGLVSGLFLLQTNLTGNAISNLSNTASSWIGGVLILIGVVAGFFWMKNRKKK